MKLKILTANIAFGLPRMDNLLVNIRSHFAFHRWSLPVMFLYPAILENHPGKPLASRVRFLKKHCNLAPIISLIAKQQPDVVGLNEIVFQSQTEELEKSLRAMGYTAFAWGRSNHHPDTTVASLIATRLRATAVAIDFPQKHYAGSGGGIAALKFSDSNITAIVVHMSAASHYPKFYDEQVSSIAKIIAQEQEQGREVMIMGDWNASSGYIRQNSSFAKLNLSNAEADIPSCPTFFPKLQPLDHIFVPGDWSTGSVETFAFGSDHLAVSAEIHRP